MTLPHSPRSVPLRLGILGTANIARGFVPPLAGSTVVRVDAVASRSREKAAQFGAEFGIRTCHASYEALLADADIDAIYIPLPNSLHKVWALRAIEAGKHVLCEKPLALNLTEAREMFEAAAKNNVMLLEAFPYMFQPQTALAVSLAQSGRIGTVQHVQAAFGFHIADPDNVRFDPALGGGALLDAGCYPVSFVRLIMGAPPQRVHAQARWHPRGVDESVFVTLEYASGCVAQVACSMRTGIHRRAMIAGTHGAIDTNYLNTTSDETPGTLMLKEGIAWSNQWVAQDYTRGSGFLFEAEAFANSVTNNDQAAIARWRDISLDNAATLDAIMESARSNRAIDVQRGAQATHALRRGREPQ
jgi:predicted dehydrogenase